MKPDLTFTATGFVGTDTWLPGRAPTCASDATTGSPVGTYRIFCDGGDAGINYDWELQHK